MNRKNFIKTLSFAMATPLISKAETALHALNSELAATDLMPLLFIGHGNPMNALYDNTFTRALNVLKDNIIKPKAILVISAHWLTKGTYVSLNPRPETIYDFGGFPDQLYKVKYEPVGAPEQANEIIKNVNYTTVFADSKMGLDHGAWTVLKHMYPLAEIPTFQLSIDYSKPETYHFELAKQLGFLRSKGVLIIGSGNIVHNLSLIDFKNVNTAYDWAVDFDSIVKKHLNDNNFKPLINYKDFGKSATLSVPTNDHYIPMLYILALKQEKEKIHYVYESMEMGSISMRSFIVK